MTQSTQNIPPELACFGQLLAPVHTDGRRLARSLAKSNAEGDDIFHDAVERAINHLSQLKDHSVFRSWFFRIIVRTHLNYTKRSFWKRHLTLPKKELAETMQQAEEPSYRARQMLSLLPPRHQQTLVMHEVLGMTVQEIATIQKVSTSGIKSRLARGRKKIQATYGHLPANSELQHPCCKTSTKKGEDPCLA